MIGVIFEKELAEHVLDAIRNGKPIHCKWTHANMLAVAGAMFYAAMSHGPGRHPAAPAYENMPPEHKEAIEETLMVDLHDAIEYCGHLTMLVKEGFYDEHFDPKYVALLTRKDGQKTVIPQEGCKGE